MGGPWIPLLQQRALIFPCAGLEATVQEFQLHKSAYIPNCSYDRREALVFALKATMRSATWTTYFRPRFTW
ncbi:hypothetical protein D3C72_632760 [compost metagenome]